MMDTKRKNILGIPVDTLSMTECLDFVEAKIQEKSKGNCILAINPEKIIRLQTDIVLREYVVNASLLIPDGVGAVLALRYLYGINIERVSGADLMQNICEQAPAKGYKIFIYGASEEVNRSAVEKLETRHPGINIVGRSNGYVSENEMKPLLEKINKSKAEILFIALGSPKQEKWISDHLHKTNIYICQGIGGTLDTIVGTVKRAPVIWRKAQAEWLYRLLKQPGRYRRYFTLPVFLKMLVKSRLKNRQ